MSCQLYLLRYNSAMRSTSYSDLRKNLAARLDEVTEDRAPLLITRERGKPAAVLMSLEDFASYEETRHLLKSPRNAERLLKAIEELDENKNGQEHELSE
jgi:antitoxin YefM